jgi:hypothetical protein
MRHEAVRDPGFAARHNPPRNTVNAVARATG